MAPTVGIVGCGRWGSVHLQAALRLKAQGHLGRVVVADTNEGRRSEAAGADATYSGLFAMCQAEPLDLVLLATPNPSHEPLGLLVLGFGLRAIIEKPFASSPEGVQRLLSEAQRNGCYVTSGHLLRHHAGIQAIENLVRNNVLGATKHMEYTRQTMRPKPEGTTILEGLASHGLNTVEFMNNQNQELRLLSIDYHLSDGTSTELNLATGAVIRYAMTEDAKAEEHARVNVSWSAEKEIRELAVVGEKGSASIDFGQHQTFTLNGESQAINATHGPLEAQILDALSKTETTTESRLELMSTAHLLENILTRSTQQN